MNKKAAKALDIAKYIFLTAICAVVLFFGAKLIKTGVNYAVVGIYRIVHEKITESGPSLNSIGTGISVSKETAENGGSGSGMFSLDVTPPSGGEHE